MSERLPGESLVRRGLEDLAAGRESAEALLVAIGAPRLRRLGVPVPDGLPPTPEHRLFRLLDREDARRAHSRYNALVRRLVSYEHARERERAALARSETPANSKVQALDFRFQAASHADLRPQRRTIRRPPRAALRVRPR